MKHTFSVRPTTSAFLRARARAIGLQARAAFARGDSDGFMLARLELDLLTAARELDEP